MSIPSIGIVGAGFVGGAMIRGFSGWTDIKVYDLGKKIGSLKEACSADIIFVCLPTPMRKNGSCDTRIVEQSIKEIDKILRIPKPVVIRSTVPPDFCAKVQKNTKAVEIMFMPEFLTERTADLDFINSPRFILGCRNPGINKFVDNIEDLFYHRFPKTRFVTMSWEAASLVKYGTNVFFTVKLSFFNELYRIAESYGVDGREVISEILQDGRIGRSHFQVPGPDGDFGWGGHCFPKDNRAFSIIAREIAEESWMTDAAWEINEEVRSNRNWEQQKGRAVSDD